MTETKRPDPSSHELSTDELSTDGFSTDGLSTDGLSTDEPPLIDVTVSSRPRAAANAAIAQTGDPPKFGIAHLMLWTACCGAYLSMVRTLGDSDPGVVGLAIVSIAAVFSGAGLAGMVVVVSRAARRVRWTIEPGQWLLAMQGAILVAQVALMVVPETILASPTAVLAAVACCLYVAPALSRRIDSLWRGFFCFLVLANSIHLLDYCLGIWFNWRVDAIHAMSIWRNWAPPFAAAVLMVVAVVDYRRQGNRGWLHWTGVVVFVFFAVAAPLLKTWF